jgi:hypothetical protein
VKESEVFKPFEAETRANNVNEGVKLLEEEGLRRDFCFGNLLGPYMARFQTNRSTSRQPRI